MQADAIPDWAIYILLTPFFPIMGFIHYSFGTLQVIALIVAAVLRTGISHGNPDLKVRFLKTIYLPFLLLPNVVVIIWSMATDPAM